VNPPTAESLQRRLERETSARRQAEALLEQKSLELFQANEALKGELAERQRSEARFRDLTELSSDWYWEQDENLRFTHLSGGSLEKGGFNPQTSLGKTRWEIPNIVMSEEQWTAHKATLVAHQPFYDLTYQQVADDGTVHYVRVSGRPILDEQGRFMGYRGTGKDITEAVHAQNRIQYLAYHDSLTELPNRAMFSELLNHAISKARRHNRRMAVLFIDLDRFKNINDTLGHEAGDTLLQEVGRRLKHTLRQSDTVARLGGDEFVVLLEEIGDARQVEKVAGKILAAVVRPFHLLGQEFRVTASIGASIYPEDGQDEQTLMKSADIAMYQAKEEGRNAFRFYSAKMDIHTFERLALESSLRRALERTEFELHYQPKRDLHSGAITGVEALLRWRHPDLGMVAPAQFISIAEETGLIVPIGKWVIKTACWQNKHWQEQGLPRMCIAVNVSARQFSEETLVQDVVSILEETGMDPDLLELEITESVVMRDPERAVKMLKELKERGIRLALDDFGTGYSSLSSLKRFPVDTIKVDRTFIRDIPGDAEDRALTQAIIAMSKTLSLTVVAEGVETKEQLEFLRQHACDEFQGYYFSKPLPAEEFARLIQTAHAEKR
jgi:diguanylate cyclase (GGDEF)-like protein/PAS domain S-box-containing protein